MLDPASSRPPLDDTQDFSGSQLLDRVMPVPVALSCVVATLTGEQRWACALLSALFVAGNVVLNQRFARELARGVRPSGWISELRFGLSLVLCPLLYAAAGASANAWHVALAPSLAIALLFPRTALLRALSLAAAMTAAAFSVQSGWRSLAAVSTGMTILALVPVPVTRLLRERSHAAWEAARLAELVNTRRAGFMAMMSHEVRTPLNGMLGLVRLLGETKLDTEQRGWLDHLSSSGELLLGVVNDVLDYSKLDAGKLALNAAPFGPAALAERCLAAVSGSAQAKGLALSRELGAVPAWLLGDAQRLQQIVLNLLTNAIKFTEHGQVTLELGYAAGQLGIAVSDTGIGIGEEQRARLFKPFEQADSTTSGRFGGTGLGLAICAQLSELMGGSIALASGTGPGARFELQLPLPVCAASPHESDKPAHALEPFADARVLVAEDNRVNQVVILALLRKRGIQAELVESGRAAVERALSAAFDLVLMDCHMPELDGFTAVAELRARAVPGRRRARLPVIALTADVGRDVKQRCLEAGMDGYMSKPIDANELDRVLSAWLEPAQPGSVPLLQSRRA